jgi:hypothetical protein
VVNIAQESSPPKAAAKAGPINKQPGNSSIAIVDTSTVEVPINSLLPADSPRLSGEDREHVKTLAQTDSPLPPIVVHRSTMRVIDGMHRLLAAQLKGAQEIPARFFDGDQETAFAFAVEANTGHGLPLTLNDRVSAAKRILAAFPHWSDRALAIKTGLAASTIAAIRENSGPQSSQPDARIGRDGRVRPLNSAAGRLMASALMAEKPSASLREIAKDVGISVSTALDVRNRLDRGDDPVPPYQREAAQKPRCSQRNRPRQGSPVEPVTILRKMQRDPSLRYSDTGRALLAWLATHSLDINQWREFVNEIPPHSRGLLTEFARGCARKWDSIASELDLGANASRKHIPAQASNVARKVSA